MGETDERHDILREHWDVAGDCLVRVHGSTSEGLQAFGAIERPIRLRTELAAAAPALARAQLITEWGGRLGDTHRCPACEGTAPYETPMPFDVPGHRTECPVDAALAEAGFPDEESRRAGRDFLEKADR